MRNTRIHRGEGNGERETIIERDEGKEWVLHNDEEWESVSRDESCNDRGSLGKRCGEGKQGQESSIRSKRAKDDDGQQFEYILMVVLCGESALILNYNHA